MLQTMDELFPERPALHFNFMLPSRSKHFLLDFRIADSHGSTPKPGGSEDSSDDSQEEHGYIVRSRAGLLQIAQCAQVYFDRVNERYGDLSPNDGMARLWPVLSFTPWTNVLAKSSGF